MPPLRRRIVWRPLSSARQTVAHSFNATCKDVGQAMVARVWGSGSECKRRNGPGRRWRFAPAWSVLLDRVRRFLIRFGERHRGANQTHEHRLRTKGTTRELGMRLRPDEVRVRLL